MGKNFSRREFLQDSALAAGALAAVRRGPSNRIPVKRV